MSSNFINNNPSLESDESDWKENSASAKVHIIFVINKKVIIYFGYNNLIIDSFPIFSSKIGGDPGSHF